MEAKFIRIDADTIQVTITGIAVVEPPVIPPGVPPVVPPATGYVRDKSKLYDVNIHGKKGFWSTSSGVGSPEAFAAQIEKNASIWLDPLKPYGQLAYDTPVQFITDWPQYFSNGFKEDPRWAKYFKQTANQ
jgi:hypothetical protein